MMYESMKVSELKALMKERDIPILKHYKKNDLVVALKMKDEVLKMQKKKTSKSKERKLELRVSKTPIDLADFYEPFNEIGIDNEYSVHNILTPILTEPEEDPGDFPNNIEEVYWGYVGDDPWEPQWGLFCKLNNGNYAYFTASRCSCGFGMWPEQIKLYVAKSYEDIIKYAMSDFEYESYMEETVPFLDKSKSKGKPVSYGCMKGIIVEEVIVMKV